MAKAKKETNVDTLDKVTTLDKIKVVNFLVEKIPTVFDRTPQGSVKPELVEKLVEDIFNESI